MKILLMTFFTLPKTRILLILFKSTEGDLVISINNNKVTDLHHDQVVALVSQSKSRLIIQVTKIKNKRSILNLSDKNKKVTRERNSGPKMNKISKQNKTNIGSQSINKKINYYCHDVLDTNLYSNPNFPINLTYSSQSTTASSLNIGNTTSNENSDFVSTKTTEDDYDSDLNYSELENNSNRASEINQNIHSRRSMISSRQEKIDSFRNKKYHVKSKKINKPQIKTHKTCINQNKSRSNEIKPQAYLKLNPQVVSHHQNNKFLDNDSKYKKNYLNLINKRQHLCPAYDPIILKKFNREIATTKYVLILMF
jgi:hypothetical protein